ncbi:MAG: Asp23/Gls24 family envelope stress response protein [Clostridia bacterium]|nr:Asp23/Gls24 family envelope stress response protein [Clostridia bacterium]
MTNEIKNELGKITISHDVIGTIAGYAAIQCYGLVGMARKKLSDGVAELLKKEALQKGVIVRVEGEQIVIDLFIVVGYGTKISTVASNVMEQVKYSVESLTGIKVAAVNVVIQGVRVTE